MTLNKISQLNLEALVANLVAAKTKVIAPVRSKNNPAQTDYLPIEQFADAALEATLPRRSIKEFFLPQSEVILHYIQKKGEVEVQEVPTKFAPQVILGAKPCDAAGVEVLDKVMNWDYRDELWFGRREATTIVSIVCPGVDDSCFCSAVGLGPDSTVGSDVLLIKLNGDYLAEAVTPKGEALLKGYVQECTDATALKKVEEVRKAAREKIAKNVPPVPAELPQWLAKNFDSAYWQSLALRCHGCGACASICPTCHCFDITDEHDRFNQGVRRRNWDSCQTSKFTVHASGHNPRGSQTERFRQRVMHKFSIYPSRFDSLLCTGCGRCARVCSAGMNLPEVVTQLIELAEAAPKENAR